MVRRRVLLMLALAGLLLVAAVLPTPLLRAIEREERRLLTQQWRATARLLVTGARRLETLEQEARAASRVLGCAVRLYGPQGSQAQAPPGSWAHTEPAPEVAEARARGDAARVRRPWTNGPPYLFLAHFDRTGHGVRLVIPLQQWESAAVARAWRAHAWSFGLALALALVLWSLELAQRNSELRLAGRIRQAARAGGPVPLQLGPQRGSAALEDLVGAIDELAERFWAAHQEQSAEAERLRSILDSMAEGVLAIDDRGRVVLCNLSLGELLVLDASRPAIGEHFLNLARHHDLAQALEYTLRTGQEFRRRLSFDPLRERGFELTVRPLKFGGGRGAVAVLVEVTRLEQLEAVRRRFLADASHELRTPLTAIRSLVENLSEGGVSESTETGAALERVLTHCDRMESLLRDITDLSRIESGAVVLNQELVPLAGLIEEVLRLFETTLRRRRIQVENAVAGDAAVFADRQRLEQILINLTDNAVKFNREGGRIRFEFIAGEEADQFAVSDTGVGIPLDQRERVFHRFYRVSRPFDNAPRGTGLGLAIVRHLVQLHGGSIEVESELGAGSRFLVTLPRPPR
jgi:two-component system phosphate regulon sensor histidine kinase PhoR